MRKWGTILVVAVGALAGESSAQGTVLVNQFPSGKFSVPTYPSFAQPAAPANTNQVADDFTVPSGQVWIPGSVEVLGLAQSGTNGSANANVWIYDGEGATPGAPRFHQAAIPPAQGGNCTVATNCNFTALLANTPRLEPGNYWISVQAEGSYRWWWALTTPDLVFGNPAVWQNPGDGSSAGCTTWRPLIDCLSVVGPEDARDMSYLLDGSIIDSRFSLGSFESKGNKIKLRATFPGPGKAKLKGKKVRKAKKTVRGGATSLPVRLTKGAQRKLSQGRTVKLAVTVTYTAAGGVPFAQKATVRVVPRRVAGAAPAFKLAR